MSPLLDPGLEDPSSTPPTPKPTSPSYPLQGTFIDTIAEVSDDLSKAENDVESLVTLLALTYKVRTPSPPKEDPLNILMRTLSSDRLGKVTTFRYPRGFTRDEVIQSFCRFLSPVLNGLAGLVGFEKAVNAGDDPEAFRAFWTLDGRNLLSDATSGTSPPSASAAEMSVPFLDTFVEDRAHKRLALTRERGLLALVPEDVREGDEVWTASYVSMPILVRRRESGGTEEEHVVVGEGYYIHGLCETEAVGTGKERYKDQDLPLSSVATGLAGGIPG